jgi:DNA-binding transcriptional ArsR family regulator
LLTTFNRSVKRRRVSSLDAVFSALADPTRRKIVARLTKGPVTLSDLAAPLPMSIPAVHKHLAILERAKLVRRERDGRFARCHLDARPLKAVDAFLEKYRVFWEDNLAELARFVEDEA